MDDFSKGFNKIIRFMDLQNVKFENKSVVFDGNPHTIEATNLPENVTVTYEPENELTNVGEVEVTATFTDTETQETDTKVAKLTVTKKVASDLKDVKFTDVKVVFDGKEHKMIEASNLPKGVTSVNTPKDAKLTNVGEVEVTATFSEDLGTGTPEKIGEKLAKLIVEKKPASDLKGVKFDSKTVTKNGEPHTIEATNLPNGVTVEYTPKDASLTDVGTLDIIATFNEDLGTGTPEKIGEKTATLTVSAKELPSIDDVIFESIEVKFDNEPHTIEATNLPDGVTVTYEPENTLTDVGAVEITATFMFDGETIGTKKATITITSDVVVEPNDDLEEAIQIIISEFYFNWLSIGSVFVGKEDNITMDLFMEFMELFVKEELVYNAGHYKLVFIYNKFKTENEVEEPSIEEPIDEELVD